MDIHALAQLLGNFGEFIGAIAVVMTLAYLAVQVRQNTSASNASGYRNAKSQLSMINTTVAQSAELTDIIERALHSYVDLEPNEKARAGWVWLSYTNTWEALFQESRESPGLQELWASEEATMVIAFQMGGYRQWWQQNRFGGTREFRDHMEQLLGRVQ